ncbi:methionine synthase [Desulfitobacterium sp. PCE1]|uniref:methionine synthase n=1 Tax=Desulfitobacterium sp. PCE1 TaxID=146907 RepID=UPI000363104D|nr:methionine synthase [Desulfitobacterium sp. PCE1]
MFDSANWQPQFLATGVGSLPYAQAETALKQIWKTLPKAPHWPQLPQLGAKSSFVGQYLRILVETGCIEGFDQPRFQMDTPDWTERMARFYEYYLHAEAGDQHALEEFSFTPEGGVGFNEFCNDLDHKGTQGALLLKGQLSGPVTLGMQITDQNRRAAYYDEYQRDILVKSLRLHARWQTRRLAQYGLPVLMSIDDPGLYAYGASTHLTLDRNTLIGNLNEVAEGILAEGGIPGVHVCAGMDWTLIFDSKIKIVNFDAYEYMTSMAVLAEPLEKFLQRGGILSWGIVPTSIKAWGETAASLGERLEGNIKELTKRGVSEDRLRSQSMLTPSCGTGTLDIDLAERIYVLLQELSASYRD